MAHHTPNPSQSTQSLGEIVEGRIVKQFSTLGTARDALLRLITHLNQSSDDCEAQDDAILALNAVAKAQRMGWALSSRVIKTEDAAKKAKVAK